MIQFDIYRDSTKQIYADDIPTFPPSEFWGNLSNKVLFIFQRLHYLNTTLESICNHVELYNFNFKLREGSNDDTKLNPVIEMIHVMGDLRMIIDELIALLNIVEKREIIGDFPKKIEIESIGDLLKKWNENKFDDVLFFVDYRDFLKNVNDITNTYKHSFINDHILFYRQLDRPTVYALRNFNGEFDLHKNKIIMIPLEDLVNDFNIMFKEYRVLLKTKVDAQLITYYDAKKFK
jgi:hypothetical protein